LEVQAAAIWISQSELKTMNFSADGLRKGKGWSVNEAVDHDRPTQSAEQECY
jgi:hypothetical protein